MEEESKLGHIQMNNMSALQQHVAFFYRKKEWENLPLEDLQGGKHGSESEVYDNEGGFDPANFDAIFNKHACTYPDRLTYEEMQAMLKGNRDVKDIFGRIAVKGEWSFLYILVKNKEGCLENEAMRGLYDGSLFEYFENQHSASAQPR